MVKALHDDSEDSWLDPCVGAGVFVKALSDLRVPAKRITAVDLEPYPASCDKLASVIRGIDFLQWSRTTTNRFDKIIGNPPYVALERLHETLKQEAQLVKDPSGKPIKLSGNYWYAFVCASLRVLNDGGSLCFILPAAWDYANYAAVLRREMVKMFSLMEVHRCHQPLFHSVQEGCVIVLARGFRQPSKLSLRFEYKTGMELIKNLQITQASSLKRQRARECRPAGKANDTCTLGKLMSVRLGGVTGDASYFLLNETKRKAHGLAVSSLRPVVSRARHLVSAILTRKKWESLKARNDRIWLFYPSVWMRKESAVRKYLELDASQGGCDRNGYKIRNRRPWYRTPLEPRFDGFVSGMSRYGPWICFRGMSRIQATNTLYTVRFVHRMPRGMKFAWALSLLTSYTRDFIERNGRVYAQGLKKYEPSDLMRIPLLIPKKRTGAERIYRKAVDALLAGDSRRSRKIADRFFSATKNR